MVHIILSYFMTISFLYLIDLTQTMMIGKKGLCSTTLFDGKPKSVLANIVHILNQTTNYLNQLHTLQKHSNSHSLSKNIYQQRIPTSKTNETRQPCSSFLMSGLLS